MGYVGRVAGGNRRLGDFGESLAEHWFIRHGWQVLARRFRVGHRDLDLVVRRGETVAFVEVKTRHSAMCGGPLSAVGRSKRRHLFRAAAVWIDRHGPAGVEYRFDVIGVLVGSGPIRIVHLENAIIGSRSD
jgi:putative endonuclease